MKLSQEYAHLYDTAIFFSIHFNRDFFEKRFKEFCTSKDTPFESLELVKNQVSDIPKMLYPFFKISDKSSAFFRFFEKSLLYKTAELDEFISIIEANKEALYNELSTIILEISDADTVIDFIEKANISDNDKLQFALVFGNFDYAVDMLCDALREVYSKVVALHSGMAAEIDKHYTELIEPSNISLLKRARHLTNEQIENSIISVSLMNPYVLYSSIETKEHARYILSGKNYRVYLTDMDNAQIASKFVAACGSELKMKMLEGLSKKKEMSLTDFARYVNLPTTTVIHNLRIMLDAGVIEISRREPKLIFYKANAPFLDKVMDGISKLITDLKD